MDERKRELQRRVAAGDDEAAVELGDLVRAETGAAGRVWLFHESEYSSFSSSRPLDRYMAFSTKEDAVAVAAKRASTLCVGAGEGRDTPIHRGHETWGEARDRLRQAVKRRDYGEALSIWSREFQGIPNAGRGVAHSLHVVDLRIDSDPARRQRNPVDDEERDLRRRVAAGEDEAVEELYDFLHEQGRVGFIPDHAFLVIQNVMSSRRASARLTDVKILGAFSTEDRAREYLARRARRELGHTNAGSRDVLRQIDDLIAAKRFREAQDAVEDRLPNDRWVVIRVHVDDDPENAS